MYDNPTVKYKNKRNLILTDTDFRYFLNWIHGRDIDYHIRNRIRMYTIRYTIEVELTDIEMDDWERYIMDKRLGCN